VVVYAVATGIPILLIGFFGHLVTRDMPHVFSISDFVGWRFGPVAKLMVFLICMFNMSIALLAEYTTIGAIFSDFVGSVSYIIIIIIGVLTLLYTAYGGEMKLWRWADSLQAARCHDACAPNNLGRLSSSSRSGRYYTS